ncbi:hypothetical protein SE17_06270 [Kouleothrix aurantiaca]|uniref:Uncharacterized protein n=1 Tax=Kouleothrix aurantiaca TaxID=186479 RepID=A0A0P9DV92_9CHLR|nr:hypothetical protein SE17_06270 [Kouleothrix aurantiaca]
MTETEHAFFKLLMETHDMSSFWQLVQAMPFAYTIAETLTLSLPLGIDDLAASCQLSFNPVLPEEQFKIDTLWTSPVRAEANFLEARFPDGVLLIQLVPTSSMNVSQIQMRFAHDGDSTGLTKSTASFLAAYINALGHTIGWHWNWRLSLGKEIVFTLNTSAGHFAHWLKKQIAPPLKFVRFGHRVDVGAPFIKRAHGREHSSAIIVEARTVTPLSARDDRSAERFSPPFRAIEFAVDELASERIQIYATCDSPWVFERFYFLLERIAETWLEAMERVKALLNPMRQAAVDKSSSAVMLSGLRPSATNTGNAASKSHKRGPRVQTLDETARALVEQWLSAKKLGAKQNAWCIEWGISPRTLRRWIKKYEAKLRT